MVGQGSRAAEPRRLANPPESCTLDVESLEPGTVFEWDDNLYLKIEPRPRTGEKANAVNLTENFRSCWFDDEKLDITIIENAVLNIGD